MSTRVLKTHCTTGWKASLLLSKTASGGSATWKSPGAQSFNLEADLEISGSDLSDRLGDKSRVSSTIDGTHGRNE